MSKGRGGNSVIAETFVRFFYYHRPLGRLVRCSAYSRSRVGIDDVTVVVAGHRRSFQRWETGRWKKETS